MNAQQAAEKVGTDARTLRRFLRSPKSTFKAVGSGGRYEFNDSDIPVLRKKFNEWRDGTLTKKAPKEPVTSKPRPPQDIDPEMPVSILYGRMTREQRGEMIRRSRERVDRLEESLRASGKHISQMSVGGRF